MRRLVLVLISLVALFTFIRAYTDEAAARKEAVNSAVSGYLEIAGE